MFSKSPFDLSYERKSMETSSIGADYVIFTKYADFTLEIVSEYDQEIPQSQTAHNPMAPLGRAAQPSRDTRKTN